jgi:alkanesulfonate monooxygenase SsuD/methylene tetrahydromethanopterin reductase-like flavin-dependent oxidoreductase (luciferase family)
MVGRVGKIEVILKAWTSNEPFSHQGHYWQFDQVVVAPPTAQRPHPPIWMGAGGESSVRRVAERGYNLLLGQYSSPADVARSVAAPLKSRAGLDERDAGEGQVRALTACPRAGS